MKREYIYHLFQKKGKKILLFLKNGVFCEVSDIAFELLKNKDWNRNELSSLSSKYSSQEIEECLEEIEILKEKGLFTHSKKSFLKKLQIAFFGGEPFLNFPLIKYVVNLCKDIEKRENKKFQFSVTTNATILDYEIIDFLRENRFGVMVSFDGTEKIHNKYRPFKNGRGSFDIVVKNIKKLSRLLPLQGRGTVVKEVINKKILERIIKNSESIGIINLALSPVDCSKIGDTYFSLNENELQKLRAFFEEITENNFTKLRKGLRPKIIFDPFAFLIKAFYEGKLNKYYRCGACFGMATVSTDGNIYPCHRFVGLHNFIIGNIFKGVYVDRIVKFFRKAEKAKGKSCTHCWINEICGGICYYYLANKDGTFNPPDGNLCDLRRKNYEATIYFMTKYYDEIYEETNIYLRATNHLC